MYRLTPRQRRLLARFAQGGDVRVARQTRTTADSLLARGLATFDYRTCRYLATDAGRRAISVDSSQLTR